MIDPTEALSFWGMEGGTLTFIAARENTVYRVDFDNKCYALRFHRQGYRTDAQLRSELDWMAWLDQSGLSVPAPLASLSGRYLHHVDGVQIDVLTWLDGNTLDVAFSDMTRSDRKNVFRQLGMTMARLHIASDAWSGAQKSHRPAWDCDGLLGKMPLWDRFWENPGLTTAQRKLLNTFRKDASTALKRQTDYGLIHADLVPANAMWNGTQLHMIDFDDGGFGFRLFDVATALFKHRQGDDYGALESALIEGYQSVRTLDTTDLPLFMALRAVTYVGWNIARMTEDTTGERNARFITQAEAVVAAYLDR
jgi:Ser/Thr protein kinase RdoA (MazF antagonist)